MNELPDVAVIVLNFNGKEHLARCLDSLLGLDYPPDKLEIVFVDNDSTDGSVDFVREDYPGVVLRVNPGNLGYARAINQAVDAVKAPFVALLNNDARADSGWLRALVEGFDDEKIAAIGSKVFSWDGRRIDYAGGGSNFHGIAFQVGQGEKDGPEYSKGGPTLFSCGAAMVVRRDVFLELGGFDDDYFAYYEDVDFGWRCWVAGYRVLYEPRAFVFHHHSATSVRIPIYKLRVLHLRNPLYTIFKNYDESNLNRVLPAALLLSLQRTWYLGALDSEPFRIGAKDHHENPLPKRKGLLGRNRERELGESQPFPKVALSDLVAFHDVLEGFEGLREKRDRIQSRRERPDEEILSLFGNPFWAVEPHPTYQPRFDQIVEFFGLRSLFPGA